MAASGRSSGSSAVLRPLSSSQRLHNHQRSASPSNLKLRLKRFSPGNIPKPSVALSNQKIKCLCSPTTHPGSFRCAFHRRLDNEKKATQASSAKRNTAKISGLNLLRKVALVNSLARIASVEAERFCTSLKATIFKPSSSLHINRRPEFRPRPSRFKVLHKDQD